MSKEWPALEFIEAGSPEAAKELATRLNAGQTVWDALVEACRILEEGAQKEIFTVPAVAAAHRIIREVLERYEELPSGKATDPSFSPHEDTPE